jgi:hypothetical protein
MQNKKAMVTTVLVDFWAIVAFILVILLFYFLIKASVDNGKEQMQIRSTEISANAMLESYLRTPVNVNGNEMQMSELIIESYTADDYKNIGAQTKNLLSHNSQWIIGMKFPFESDNKCVEYTSTEAPGLGTCAVQLIATHSSSLSSFLLPAPNGKTIKVWIAKKL